jgi:hypothetical protein
LAQVINFPLQRNITFRSHGNPYPQAAWYFIGWVLTSLFCNGINSLWLPLGAANLPFAVYNILTMISMGGISMVIFFFIFLIIFPDYNAAQKRAAKKLERLRGGADAAKTAAAEKTLEEASVKAELANAEKAKAKTAAQAGARAIAYFAAVKAYGGDGGKTAASFAAAAEAIAARTAAAKAYEQALARAQGRNPA